MDETGHSGDAGAAVGGNGADSRDRTRVNGWANADNPWSSTGAAADQEADVPAWRRSQEGHTYGRQPYSSERPYSSAPASAIPAPSPATPGHGEIPAEIPPSGNGSGEPWPAERNRLADILGRRSAPPPPPAPGPGPTSGAGQREFEPTAPHSAPPYPYEGDLDDSYRDKPPTVSQRAAVPMNRPPMPTTRPGWAGVEEPPAVPQEGRFERSRHAMVTDTLAQGLPRSETPADGEAAQPRSAYDTGGFPRRAYEPAPAAVSPLSAPPAFPSYPGNDLFPGNDLPGNEFAGSDFPGNDFPGGEFAGSEEPTRFPGLEEPGGEAGGGLPQRVPAQPDVPRAPEPAVEPSAEVPALARIATHLRRGDVVPAQERQEGFDVQDILAAVREVPGVRDASLRATPAGAHSLRLDLSDGADPAEVSRQVARLLQDRMGLDAAMPGDGPAVLGRPAGSPFVPGQPSRASRAPASTPVSAAPASAPPLPAPASAPPMTAPASAPPFGIPPATAPASGPPFGVPPLAAAVQAAAAAAPASAPPAYSPPAYSPAVPVTPVSPAPRVVPASVVPAEAGKPRPLDPGDHPGPRVIIENVHVNTFGADATVEVRLQAGGRTASGVATGPAVDGYLLRLCATATAGAVDQLLSSSRHQEGPARCFVEHAAAVSFGSMQVAVVVLLLSTGGGWVEQLAGSAVVTGDDRHAMVRATLAAVNRRLEALLS